MQNHDAHAALQLVACEPQQKAVVWAMAVHSSSRQMILALMGFCFKVLIAVVSGQGFGDLQWSLTP